MIITPLQQHQLGWDIFPIAPDVKTRYTHRDLETGESVPTKWVDGWVRLTPEQVVAYWPEPRTHNIGLATGHRSGVWVLDIDAWFETEDEARAYFAEMTSITLPETLSVRTASGKWHFYFAMPADAAIKVKTTQGKLAPLVDVRGDGGMAMGIGSTVVDSDGVITEYEVVTMVRPVPAPVALLDRVKAQADSELQYGEASSEKDVDSAADQLAANWINENIQRLVDLKRPWELGAGWHDVCFEVACALNEFANSPWCSLTPERARQMYFAAAPPPEPKWNPAHEWGEGVKKTQGKGRIKPLTSADMEWFNLPSAAPAATVAEDAAGEIIEIGPPRTWAVEINQVQPTGATFPLANEIRKAIPQRDEVPMLTHHQGVWLYWNGSFWTECQPDDIFDLVARLIVGVAVAEKTDDGVKQKPLAPNVSKVKDVESALASLLRRPEVDEELGGVNVFVKNGVLRILDSGERLVLAPSPITFNLNALPFATDPSATCPTWLSFLADVFEHDPAAADALQEWFGYFLRGEPSWLQKMFWLIGPRRSGKGTILQVARSLMGVAATATSLTQLSKDFGRENLVGKRLAIIDDSRDPDPRIAHSVVEFLLTMSAGGYVSIARKHRRNWDGNITASLLAASNTIPRLPDEGGAVSSRLEIIRTRKSFLGHEDTHLFERLQGELPGIMNWAIEGLVRLQQSGRFTQSGAAKEVREDVELGATGATPFVKELLTFVPYDRVNGGSSLGLKKVDLRSAVEWWSRQQEDVWKPNRLSLKSAILAEFPDARDNQRIVTPYGEQVNKGWRGVVLKCRECENHAMRVTEMSGPECSLHLSNIFPVAISGGAG